MGPFAAFAEGNFGGSRYFGEVCDVLLYGDIAPKLAGGVEDILRPSTWVRGLRAIAAAGLEFTFFSPAVP